MIIDNVSPGPSRTSVSARVTLQRAPRAGRVFQVIFSVCDNPCCPCENVLCQCTPVSGKAAGSPPPGAGGATALEFSLDLGHRHLARAFGAGVKAAALGRDFTGELTPDRWDWIWQFFLAAKRGLMTTVDLETVNIQLPAEVLAGEGSMLGYFEVFPWAEVLGFQHGGSKWVVDDQYCASPGCACKEAALWLFRQPEKVSAVAHGIRSSGVLTLDYETGRFTLQGEYEACPPGQTLLDALKVAEPELEAKLRRRHAQIKHLGRRFLEGRTQHGSGPLVGPPTVAAPPEPPRATPARPARKPRRKPAKR